MRLLKLLPLLLAALPLVFANECKGTGEKCQRNRLYRCEDGKWKGYGWCHGLIGELDARAACVPNSHRCKDNKLQVCALVGGWKTQTRCSSHETCYANDNDIGGGGCRALVERRTAPAPEGPVRYSAGELCAVNTTRCHDNQVQSCPEPNTWTMEEVCPTGQVCVQDCAATGCTARCHAASSGPDPLYPDCEPGKRKCDYNLAILLTCNKLKQWETEELCPKAGDCKPDAVGEAHCERADPLPVKPTSSGYAPPPSITSSVAPSSAGGEMHILPMPTPSAASSSTDEEMRMLPISMPSVASSSTDGEMHILPISTPLAASSVASSVAPSPTNGEMHMLPVTLSSTILTLSWSDTWSFTANDPTTWTRKTKTQSDDLFSMVAASSSSSTGRVETHILPAPTRFSKSRPASGLPTFSFSSINTDTIPHAPPPITTPVPIIPAPSSTVSASLIDTDTIPHAPPPPITTPVPIIPPSNSTVSASSSIDTDTIPHAPPPPKTTPVPIIPAPTPPISSSSTFFCPPEPTPDVPHGPPPAGCVERSTTSIVSLSITRTVSATSIDTDTIPHAPPPPKTTPVPIITISSSSTFFCPPEPTPDVPHGPPPPGCVERSTTLISVTSASLAKATPAANSCRAPGSGRCTADNHVEACTPVDGILMWQDAIACAADQTCYETWDGKSAMTIAMCDKSIEKVKKEYIKGSPSVDEPESCEQPGNDRCMYAYGKLHSIDKCFERNGVQAWYEINTCPKGTVCLADIDEATGTVIGGCARPVTDPLPSPDACTPGSHTCSEDLYTLQVCNNEQATETEQKCTYPGDCKVDGPDRAHCELGGIAPPKAKRTTSTDVLPARRTKRTPTSTVSECLAGERACDSERRWLFECGPDNTWTKMPRRCFGPGWCKITDPSPMREAELRCTGEPLYVNTPTCLGRCEFTEYQYICGSAAHGDPVKLEECRVQMCRVEKCQGCDRCTHPPNDEVVVPDLSTLWCPSKGSGL